MPSLRQTSIRSLRRSMLEHYLGGVTHDAAVLYDIDNMTLTPAYGGDIAEVMHAEPRKVMVDYVSSGQFVVHEHRRAGKPAISRMTRRNDRVDMAVRLRDKIEWLSDNLTKHRMRHPQVEWEALCGVFEGPPPDMSLIERWRGMYGGEYSSDRYVLCLNTFSNYLRLEGVERWGPSREFTDQHPSPIRELWTRGSCLVVSPPYSADDWDMCGGDFVLDSVKARLAALYDFPPGSSRDAAT